MSYDEYRSAVAHNMHPVHKSIEKVLSDVRNNLDKLTRQIGSRAAYGAFYLLLDLQEHVQAEHTRLLEMQPDANTEKHEREGGR